MRFICVLLLNAMLSFLPEQIRSTPNDCGTISGIVGEDLDGDNLNDLFLENVTLTLYLDINGNGKVDGSEGDTPVNIDPDGNGVFDTPGIVITDINGLYTFDGVPVGDYVIIETQPLLYISQVEYDGGDDGDQPDNGIDNSIPVVIIAGETDTGNDFIERKPLFDIIIYSVPGTLNDQYALSAQGSLTGLFNFTNNIIVSGQSTGQDTAFSTEMVNVLLTNVDNNASWQNYSILFEVKNKFGTLISSGTIDDGSILLINNNKDATFDFSIPSEDAQIKIILVKQSRIVFFKETIPASEDSDFTFNKLLGGTGIPASFMLDGESIDGPDADLITNQVEYQFSGGEQGIYTIQEQSIPGWKLESISCFTIDGNLDESINVSNGTLNMDIQNGDKSICTFTNIKLASITGNVLDDGVGIANVSLSLQDTSGAIISTVTTSDGLMDVDGDGSIDPIGFYSFINVIPGDYNILEQQPLGYEDVSEIDGGDDLDRVNNHLLNNIPSRVLPGEVDTGNDFNENATALPVRLISFDIISLNCEREVIWSVTNVSNHKSTELQLSDDGFSWLTVYTVNPDNVSSQQDYKYLLDDRRANLYLRLRFNDHNGAFSFSDILKSTTNCDNFMVTVYPNPVSSILMLELRDNQVHEDLKVTLVDHFGKKVLEFGHVQGSKGSTFSYDISALAPGTYYLNIEDKSGVSDTSKILKL